MEGLLRRLARRSHRLGALDCLSHTHKPPASVADPGRPSGTAPSSGRSSDMEGPTRLRPFSALRSAVELGGQRLGRRLRKEVELARRDPRVRGNERSVSCRGGPSPSAPVHSRRCDALRRCRAGMARVLCASGSFRTAFRPEAATWLGRRRESCEVPSAMCAWRSRRGAPLAEHRAEG